MSYAVDFKQVAQTPIRDVAGMLGLELKEVQTEKHGVQLVGSCPISGSGNATVFKLTPAINRYICFCPKCNKKGGDCVELVRRVRGLDDKQALLAAQEIINHFKGADKGDDNPPPKQEVPPPAKPSTFDPLKYLAGLDPAHEALTGLGISPQTFTDFKAGYQNNRGPNKGRLCVAICDVTGEIKAFVGIALNDEEPKYNYHDKYRPPYWFNTHNVKEGNLWIVSDILQVMDAAANGETNIICPLVPTNADALTSLKALILDAKCTVCF